MTRSSVARLPPAVGANGEPPRPPRAVSKRSTPSSIAVQALSSAVPRVSWRCRPTSLPVGVEDLADAPRRGHPGGVGEGDLCRRRRRGRGRRASATSSGVISSPSNGEPKQHEITASSTAVGCRGADRRRSCSSASVDRHVHVLLAVRRRRRHGDRQVVDAGGGRQLGALDVGDERPQRDVVVSAARSVAATTSAAPAIAGTAFGLTNEATSMSLRPARSVARSAPPAARVAPAVRPAGRRGPRRHGSSPAPPMGE